MKYAVLLAAIAVVYYFLSRSAPLVPVAQAVTAQEAVALSTGPRPSSATEGSALKQPLNRTRAALDQVQRRNGDGEF